MTPAAAEKKPRPLVTALFLAGAVASPEDGGNAVDGEGEAPLGGTAGGGEGGEKRGAGEGDEVSGGVKGGFSGADIGAEAGE